MDNAEKHGCDSSKISVGGISGGAWVTIGGLIMLSREDQEKCDKVKLMILSCPMLGAAAERKVPKEEMLEWEKPISYFIQCHPYDLFSDNWEANKADPLLVPFSTPIEEMKKLPKCVLQTSEFDFINRDVHLVIPRMKEAGIYLDHMDYSSVGHGF